MRPIAIDDCTRRSTTPAPRVLLSLCLHEKPLLLPPMTSIRRFILALPVITSLASTTIRAQQRFTLEQVMSAPFPDELVAAPAGGAVAWVFNDRGARNIWVAAPPDYRGHAITTYPDDDGQEITQLRWTADARWIVYVRGGGKNGRGEYPNPRSVASGVTQEIWLVAVAGGTPRR